MIVCACTRVRVHTHTRAQHMHSGLSKFIAWETGQLGSHMRERGRESILVCGAFMQIWGEFESFRFMLLMQALRTVCRAGRIHFLPFLFLLLLFFFLQEAPSPSSLE